MDSIYDLRKRDYWPTKEWKVASLKDKGGNPKYLLKMENYIKEKCHWMRSVLLIKDGYIIYEKYNNGFNQLDLQEQWSITKSIISALVGIMINDGGISNVEQSIVDFFEDIPEGNKNEISKIKIRNLLNMTSGFHWDRNTYEEWLRSSNLVDFILKTDVEFEPGKHFFYDDHNPYMLSAIINKVSGLSAEKYAEKHLFNYLGIENYKWEKDASGINIGGYGTFLTARDMAKIGYLFLNYGVWEDRQIIAPNWIKELSCIQSKGGLPENDAYGYLWWITKVEEYDAYYACGFGGQYIYIIPELDIVFVTTASPYDSHQENKNLILEYIIPSVIDNDKSGGMNG